MTPLTAIEPVLEQISRQLAGGLLWQARSAISLEVLKLELEFLKVGGYRKGYSWRPQFIFEDSPTCLNYGDPERKRPCSECVLMSLVPAEFREGKLPCHYISLNERNDTIQSLQQWSTPEELEDAVREWLMNTIQVLELERAQGQADLAMGKAVGQA